jgi:hypothetical protein
MFDLNVSFSKEILFFTGNIYWHSCNGSFLHLIINDFSLNFFNLMKLNQTGLVPTCTNLVLISCMYTGYILLNSHIKL